MMANNLILDILKFVQHIVHLQFQIILVFPFHIFDLDFFDGSCPDFFSVFLIQFLILNLNLSQNSKNLTGHFFFQIFCPWIRLVSGQMAILNFVDMARKLVMLLVEVMAIVVSHLSLKKLVHFQMVLCAVVADFHHQNLKMNLNHLNRCLNLNSKQLLVFFVTIHFHILRGGLVLFKGIKINESFPDSNGSSNFYNRYSFTIHSTFCSRFIHCWCCTT